MNLAAEAVPLHEGLIRLAALGAVGPDGGAGVGGVEQTAPEHPAVVAAGVGHVTLADEAVSAVNAGVALVAEDRDGDVGVPRAVLTQAGLAKDQRPARVAILLAQLRGLRCQSSGIRPSLIAFFSSSDVRCFGAETRLASTIWPDIGM
jgi:hypothetical protein